MVDLAKIVETATEARGKAHEAYEIALRNSRAAGDTEAAYRALVLANQVLQQAKFLQTQSI